MQYWHKLFPDSLMLLEMLGLTYIHVFLCVWQQAMLSLYSVSPFSVLPVYYLCIPFIFMNKAQGYVSISQIYAAATYVDTHS